MTEAVGGKVASSTDAHNGAQDVPKVHSMLASTSQGVKALKDITFGSTAGMIGKMFEYPFDTIKVRLQSQPFHQPAFYSGPLDCFRKSLRSDGAAFLYRGISVPLFGAAIETSSLFFSYRLAQNALQVTVFPQLRDSTLPLSALILCGAMSGAFTSLLLTPIELIKCKMQVTSSSSQQFSRSISIIASVYRHHGIRGFWHGQLGTLIRETGGTAAWFGSYESFIMLFRRRDSREDASTNASPSSPVWQRLLAGAAAGVSYNFIFYPADTIKSRMQTEEVGPALGKRGKFWMVGKALWRQQGVRGLYKGCGITVARAAPSSALIFAIYEALQGRFAGPASEK